MKRREVLALIGGAAMLGPVPLRAEASRVRRLAVIMASNQTAEFNEALSALEDVLRSRGWRRDDNLRIDLRWSAADPQRTRAIVQEIVGLQPDVIFAQSTAVVAALVAAAPGQPVVFVHVGDPVGSGFVASLARPGGSVTGVTNTEPSLGGKWLQLLKEVAPSLSQATMLLHPETQPGGGALYRDSFEAAASSLQLPAKAVAVHDLPGIDAAIAGLAGNPPGGLIVTPDPFFANHSAEIVALVQHSRLPSVYPYRYYVAKGGLLSYGVENVDLFRAAAAYVDRILRGERPGDLPVQRPTRFKLILNAGTAKALGLTVPPNVLAGADEIID